MPRCLICHTWYWEGEENQHLHFNPEVHGLREPSPEPPGSTRSDMQAAARDYALTLAIHDLRGPTPASPPYLRNQLSGVVDSIARIRNEMLGLLSPQGLTPSSGRDHARPQNFTIPYGIVKPVTQKVAEDERASPADAYDGPRRSQWQHLLAADDD
jgi:hypothetical protein